MFQKIDWFFLSHFEKGVCHPLQRLTGKTNYYYAGLCSFLVVFISLGEYFDIFSKGLADRGDLVSSANGDVLFWFSIFIFASYCATWKIFEAAGYTRLNDGMANSLKVMPVGYFGRNLIVLLLPLFLVVPEIQICDKAFFVFLTLFFFFVSCDPLPPCKGKVKEWLKSFSKKPALATAKTGE
jgi:hypothetical protein